MRNATDGHDPAELGELERQVLDLVWSRQQITADAVREALDRPLKDSTVRTVLRRLEEKGYLVHATEGRTFVYRPAAPREHVAARAVKRIADWFCGRLRRIIVGWTGGKRRPRPEGVTSSCRKDCASERRKKMMLAILLEAAVRSLALGTAAWLGLRLMRVRNLRAERLVWLVVLCGSLLMPLVMQWRLATFTLPGPASPETLRSVGTPVFIEPVQPAAPVHLIRHGVIRQGSFTPAKPAERSWTALPWQLLGAVVYICVAAILLLRLGIGLALASRLWRHRSKPWPGLGFPPAGNVAMRVSRKVKGPVTVAQGILLPEEALEWTGKKLEAVVRHEQCHVEQHDFAWGVLAKLHAAVFWFSPLSWWLERKLSEVSEVLADEAGTRKEREPVHIRGRFAGSGFGQSPGRVGSRHGALGERQGASLANPHRHAPPSSTFRLAARGRRLFGNGARRQYGGLCISPGSRTAATSTTSASRSRSAGRPANATRRPRRTSATRRAGVASWSASAASTSAASARCVGSTPLGEPGDRAAGRWLDNGDQKRLGTNRHHRRDRRRGIGRSDRWRDGRG